MASTKLTGRGVFYGAAVAEAQGLQDERVCVVRWTSSRPGADRALDQLLDHLGFSAAALTH